MEGGEVIVIRVDSLVNRHMCHPPHILSSVRNTHLEPNLKD